jgi:ketosteroid isomerase-like protein
MILRAAVTLLFALAATPLAAQEPPPPDTTATKAALLSADSALAQSAEASEAAAFLEALGPGAALLFTGQPILSGAEEALPAFTARYGGQSSYTWRPVHAVASVDGRFGCTIGFSRFSDAADTTGAERPGTYITCWQQGADGEWRIVGHQRNDSPPRATQETGGVWAQAPHSATVSSSPDPLRDAIEADAAFAERALGPGGPGPAFAEFAAPDGMLLGGGEPPRGPTQILEAFEGFFPDRVILWEPTRTLGAGSGGLAFTVGHSVTKPGEGRSGEETHGKYLTVWRQEPDGRWAYIFDLGSPRP